MKYIMAGLDQYIDMSAVTPEPSFVQIELTETLARKIRIALDTYANTEAELQQHGMHLTSLEFSARELSAEYTLLYGAGYTEGVFDSETKDQPEDIPDEPIDLEEIYAKFEISEEIHVVLSFGGSEYFCDLSAELFGEK